MTTTPSVVSTHDNGDLVRCRATFANGEGALIDPATVTFKAIKPDRSTITLVYGTDAALVKESTGVYYTDLNANQTGVWYYRFESTGTGQAAEEFRFKVARSEFYPQN